MAEVEIVSGICGFQTKVRAEKQHDFTFTLQVTSTCEHVIKMVKGLGEIDAMQELFKKGESRILAESFKHLPHVTCPVAVGMLKALEVSAGLALPKDVSISFTG